MHLVLEELDRAVKGMGPPRNQLAGQNAAGAATDNATPTTESEYQSFMQSHRLVRTAHHVVEHAPIVF